MAFPRNIDPAAPAGTDLISLGDDQIRTLKQDLIDLFGLPSTTNITAEILNANADGTISAIAEIQGLVTLNRGTSPLNVLLVGMAQPTVAGQRDSHDIMLRGTAFDTAGHNADWRTFVDVTSNAGASNLLWQTRIDAASFVTKVTMTTNGLDVQGTNANNTVLWRNTAGTVVGAGLPTAAGDGAIDLFNLSGTATVTLRSAGTSTFGLATGTIPLDISVGSAVLPVTMVTFSNVSGQQGNIRVPAAGGVELSSASSAPVGAALSTTAATAVAITTNSVERLRVVSGGNVGIGTAAPGRLLQVGDATTAANVQVGIDTAAGFEAAVYYQRAGVLKWGVGRVSASDDFGWVDATGERMRITQTAGMLLIGDTTNANMTTGLTINQGAADDEIFALKSSDVAHGLTVVAETDTYMALKKGSATLGGVFCDAIAESTAATAITIVGRAGQPSVTPGISADPSVLLAGTPHDGLGATVNLAANALVFGVSGQVGGTSRRLFFVDAEGDLHVDGSTTLTAFDAYDDVALLTGFRGLLMPECDFRQRFATQIAEAKEILHRHRVITYNAPDDIFVSYKGLQGLLIDTIRQLASRIEALEAAHG